MILAGIAAIGIVTYFAPLEVETLILEPGDARVYFMERGIVRNDVKMNIFPIVSGQILSLEVREGQEVSAGDIIAIVDSRDFYFEIARLRANNASIAAQIRNMDVQDQLSRNSQPAARESLLGEYNAILAQEAMAPAADRDQNRIREENIRLQNILIEQSRNNLEATQRDLVNFTTLFEAGAVSRTQLDQTVRAAEAFQTDLDAHIQQLEIISTGQVINQEEHFSAIRSSIQAQINGIDRYLQANSIAPMRDHFNVLIQSGNLTIANLERMVEDSALRSPVDGIISALFIEHTNVVNMAVPMAEITTGEDNLIEVFVSTLDIDEINLRDTVEIILRRQREDISLPGIVYAVDNAAELRISTLGVEERRVEVLIEPLGKTIPSGFDVDVVFTTHFESGRVLIPRTAVFSVENQDMVFVVENGVAVLRSVVLGLALRTDYIAEQGLEFGEEIIRNANTEGLSNGIRVANPGG